ncbi:MAG: ABC transporter permease [Lachnospiraceae bacterium]|nr:ABC transporter permease [Lachnospiraceae bacterium]
MKKSRKIEQIRNIILLFSIPVIVFVLWWYCSGAGIVNPSILPSPQRVWAALVKQIEKGSLWVHISSSFVRVIKGYMIGTIAGLLLGTLAALSKTVGKLIEVPVGILRPIPAIALIPFFILWMGIGESSKVSVIVFGSFWPVLLNTIQGIQSTDKKLLEVGEILEKNRLIVLTQIVLPSALPAIFTGLRLGISSAWTCVVAAEMIAASSGIGFLISYSREMAQPATLLVGIATIGLFGLLIDVIFKRLNYTLIYWQREDK